MEKIKIKSLSCEIIYLNKYTAGITVVQIDDKYQRSTRFNTNTITTVQRRTHRIFCTFLPRTFQCDDLYWAKCKKKDPNKMIVITVTRAQHVTPRSGVTRNLITSNIVNFLFTRFIKFLRDLPYLSLFGIS